MNNTTNPTKNSLFRSLVLTLAAVTLGLLLTSSTSSAQPAGVGNGQVDWNGWTMTYGVDSGSDGLRLGDVTHDGTQMLARISMPVMNVFYEIDDSNGGCGPYADLIGGADFEGVFTNEFTQDGEQWLELAIQDIIGAYIIYQSYYFSESGIMDAHIFSRALQCDIYHEHLPFWRMDFAVEGDAEDEVVRLAADGSYAVETQEFDSAANAAVNHEWYVRDGVSGTSVRINFDDGTYNLPGEIVPETDYIENNVYGRQYEPSDPEIVWKDPPRRDLGFNEGDNIDDLVLWYTGFMPHSPEEGPDLWHSTGVRMQIVEDPEVVAPTPTPAPPTATATTVPPTATTVPPTPTATTVPPTPVAPTATALALTPTTVPPTPVAPTATALALTPTTVPPTPTTVPPTATTVPPTATPAPPASAGCNFATDFIDGAGEFVFVEKSSTAKYFSGSASGNALTIELGGVDNKDIFDIGSFWARSCDAANAGQVNISLVASMTMASDYEADEFSQMGITVNGQSTVLAELVGNGNGGPALTTGTQTYTLTADMVAGLNAIALDCFNNKKTWNDETIDCRFESISVSSAVSPPPTPITGVPPTATPSPTGPTQLTSGQTVNGLAGSPGDELFYAIEVPAGMSTLEVVMAGAGDADLYTLFGAVPSDKAHDCGPYIDGSSSETCTITNPAAGTHYIRVNGWDAFAGVNLTAIVISASSAKCDLVNGVAQTGFAGSAGSTFSCEIVIPAGAQTLNVDMAGGGDADLYLKKGSAPTLKSYDCLPYVDGSSVESCTQLGAVGGTWYVMVNGWSAYQDVSLTATWTDVAAVPTLSSGDSVVLSGSAGDELVYSVTLPFDGTLLTVDMSGGTGDADLYLRGGELATLADYDCRPYLDKTNDEECVVATPTGSTYYITIRGYSDFADATLSLAYALP